ncbi:MAG TPA: ABC transporter permease [Thermoanaerobaculia bacterium]|jgi:predicted permease
MSVPLDVRYGFRKLNNNVGFTVVAVACLALGICASVTVFSVVDTLLLRPFPGVVEPARIVSLAGKPQDLGVAGEQYSLALSYPTFQRYRSLSRSFSGLVAYFSLPLNLAGTGEPLRVSGQIVTDDYFKVLGLKSSLGRLFSLGEGAREKQPEAVIGYDLWRRVFGGRPTALGRTLDLNGRVFVVVGVAPRGFHGTLHTEEIDVWVPMETAPLLLPTRLPAGLLAAKPAWLFWFFGRLAPGVDLARAQAEMDRLAALGGDGLPPAQRPPALALYPELGLWPGSQDTLTGPLLLLSIVTSLLMLVVCANLGGLLLVRTAARQEEIGVRLALGVTRSRLVRQLLTESVALSLVGGLVGFLLALFTVDAIQGLSLGRFLPTINNLGVGGRVILFSCGLSLGAGVVFGLAPALWSTRRQGVPMLRRGGEGVPESGRTRLQELLVVGQVTVSLMLLVCTGLFVRTLQNLRSVDPGFNSRHVVNLRMDLSLRNLPASAGLAFYDQLRDQVGRVAGVKAAALTLTVPLARVAGETRIGSLRPLDAVPRPPVTMEYDVVSPGFFATLGIGLVRGRDFSAADGKGAPAVAILDELAARALWPGRDPVGERVATADGTVREVVGVVRRIRFSELPTAPNPYFYLPLAQHYEPAMALQVRTTGDPLRVAEPARAILRKLDPNLGVQVSRFGDEVEETLAQPRLFSWLFGSFSLTALLVTAIGLYGTLSFAVSRRTRELGIRMALGARASEIVAMVLRRGLALTLAGLVLGIVAAVWATSLFSNLLFGVTPTDPAVFAAVALLLGLVGLAASSVPAYRATRVDPMSIIRHE